MLTWHSHISYTGSRALPLATCGTAANTGRCNQPTGMPPAAQILDLLQWPAMVMTVIAAWLVASRARHRREVAFWCFLASNVLWVVWGFHDHAYALVALQVVLAFLNVRGADKNADAPRES